LAKKNIFAQKYDEIRRLDGIFLIVLIPTNSCIQQFFKNDFIINSMGMDLNPDVVFVIFYGEKKLLYIVSFSLAFCPQ
jgi:hypothetical protein